VNPCIAPLFVPGDRPDRFLKAARSGADAVIIDLEDAVAPGNKPAAREALTDAPFKDAPVYLRINGSRSDWYAQDIKAAAGQPWAGILLPKAEGAAEVAALWRQVGVPIIAMVESALGLANARAMAAVDGVVRLAFGSIDFAADLGAAPTREALLAARSELVLASRLGGCHAPLDGVTANLEDAALAEADARHALSLGFGGKFAIHPRQVAAILAGFAPGDDEVAWARRILATGKDGAERIGDGFADAPVRRRAEAIMARADQRKGKS
jgi:citrate lyase subunit beta/citryl-CoA lyase